jgi:hypothetical protein
MTILYIILIVAMLAGIIYILNIIWVMTSFSANAQAGFVSSKDQSTQIVDEALKELAKERAKTKSKVLCKDFKPDAINICEDKQRNNTCYYVRASKGSMALSCVKN